jgi:hypothetical protein
VVIFKSANLAVRETKAGTRMIKAHVAFTAKKNTKLMFTKLSDFFNRSRNVIKCVVEGRELQIRNKSLHRGDQQKE